MKTFFHFVIYTVLALAAIVLGIMLGDYGSWYFAWLIGTGMIVLIAASGAVYFDSQEEDEANGGHSRRH